MRLLLIEDDTILGEGLRDYLRSEGHVVDWCTHLAQADATRGEPYDGLLIDWQLPDGSGLSWLRAVRARGEAIPALVLTARDSLDDRIHGLDQGADDYLVKPFAPEELAARLRVVARRSAAAPRSRLVFGEVEMDLHARAVWRAGERVDLTAREWTVLEALAMRAGRIVPKADLEKLVLGMDADVSSNVVEVHVSNLRRKLGRRLLDTVRGLGYRMEAP
ncbi:response regulator transcription factor [Leptothrix sp. BB-4]